MSNILLTGTSSGFGLLTAKILALQGHTVYATMRNVYTKNVAVASDLQKWASDNNADIKIGELDITQPASVADLIARMDSETTGAIDVLVNNAGAAFIGLNETLSAEQTNDIFQVNVIGVDRMIKAVLPHMHRQGKGLIITLSSVAARQYTPAMGVYAASKAAVDALCVSYHYELKNSGIDVTLIQPGAYPTTDIVSKQAIPTNTDVEKYYSPEIIKYKEGVFKNYEVNENSPDSREVCDVIVSLINSKDGLKQLWTLVGAGPLGVQIGNINTGIRNLTESILQASGMVFKNDKQRKL
jgi:NAD(P)-dependent dehydrogenase (short-subunit alcohol dehydrogenase family)